MLQLRQRQGLAGSQTANSDTTPVPEYIFRAHTVQINTLSFSRNASLLFSGDADGYVAAWSLKTFRPVLFAKLHAGSVLTVVGWGDNKLISHGRDNKIHVIEVEDLSSMSNEPAPSPSSPSSVEPLYTIETNALGYCKCSVLQDGDLQALIAVPATLQDDLIDIFHVPSCKRVYRSIGKNCFESKTGTVMAISISLDKEQRLRIFATYEDGCAAMFIRRDPMSDMAHSELAENRGWEKVFQVKEHREPTMSVALQADRASVWSVGADHMVVKYNLDENSNSDRRARPYKTAYPGKAAIEIRDDDRILAIAGWDGDVRVHSVKTFKPLAVLQYHRNSVFTVAFAPTLHPGIEGLREEVANSDPITTCKSRAWLACAGQDTRISLWEIYPM